MEMKNVVFHYPGPKWNTEYGFREQPGIMAHVEHYQMFHKEGKLLFGGPFVGSHVGGMMIAAENVSSEELEEFAASDPAVKNGLLTYEVKTWYVAMKSSVES